MANRTFWLETLGCPKNDVDSDKLTGALTADGYVAAGSVEEADLVVVNTCAFIEAAREESIGVALQMAEDRKDGAKLVLTGCMAERYGSELSDAMPEVDVVAGFGDYFGSVIPAKAGIQGTAVAIGTKPGIDNAKLDLLNLPRPKSSSPWAYVKIAEGCDRKCGFCAIPSFRGKQDSRTVEAILEEVDQLNAKEIVLIAQDLASFGRERKEAGSIVPLISEVAKRVERVRCLYLYPSDLSDELIDVIGSSSVPYYDLSLQHVSQPLLRRMRRWGSGDKFIERIHSIRAKYPEAAFRSNFIVGYPGETEEDHDALLEFVDEAKLDWCGFFSFSKEAGTYAADLDGEVPKELIDERMLELVEKQDFYTAASRENLVGRNIDVLVDRPGIARSHREAPEIDGIVEVPDSLTVGEFHTVLVTGAAGGDLVAEPVVANDLLRITGG